MDNTFNQLQAENQQLREIVRDFHWQARRYCDGRMTYVTSLFNEHTRSLLALGVDLNDDNGQVFARDGMGRSYDGLTDEEAAPAPLFYPPMEEAERLSRETENLAKVLWAEKSCAISSHWERMSSRRRDFWRREARKQLTAGKRV